MSESSQVVMRLGLSVATENNGPTDRLNEVR
jgi:hypothetical protein